jgi:hypothetical protein
MGGADSIDKQWRTTGVDWFHEELIHQDDVDRCPDISVDIIMSHTCPYSLLKSLVDYERPEWRDSSQQALEILLNKYRPSAYYFAHFHKYVAGHIGLSTQWYCLNELGKYGGWANL